MPNWNQVLKEIQESPRKDALDFVRRKYIKKLAEVRGRNIIAYYSGWLQKPGLMRSSINDDDKNGFMATIHGLDRPKGLDLILHTPGGDMAATESIVDYLQRMFGQDIVCYIPQIAMSGGTMIACSCKEIVMGKQSNIGPIDPQFGGIPAHGVIQEFETAIKAIKADPQSIPIWQKIVEKYHPTFLGECRNAIKLSEEMLHSWLTSNMFANEKDRNEKASKILKYLSDHSDRKTHARHINIDEAKGIGLKISELEKNNQIQDIVLTIHHSFMHTFSNSNAIKIIENNIDNAIISFTAINPSQ
jgi:membrane-bound ClpP family serine protease